LSNRVNGKWYYSLDHGQYCQVIETQTLWGEEVCRVWVPANDSVAYVPVSRLKPPEDANTGSSEHIAYVAAAARVAEALTEDILLAPIESSVIPLPHQLRALSRAISGDRVRYLLADEVGLGKTIEAGLILRELKLRGLVRRTLVVAPKGLVTQWVSEMRFHFGETFHIILPEDIRTLKRITTTHESMGDQLVNTWQLFSQVVVPMDSIKPLDKRRGWTDEQVSEYNRERFEDLIAAGWDLIIVDEAHRLGGSTEHVARFKLGQGLADAASFLLLLSATPHQGKTDAFYRIISLIDSQEFPDIGSVTREKVQRFVIRTEKRFAIDADGNPLFKPRRTQLVSIAWERRHNHQELLYNAVTEYVRKGYNKAMQEKRHYIGFLLLLMQRLVVSSTRAIRTTLERRLQALEVPQEQLTLFPTHFDDEWNELDGQEQVDILICTRLNALKNERAEVKLLLEVATRCEQAGPDAKAEALLEWIYRLQAEEGDHELKVLIFTEFVPTQEMLCQFLEERGFAVVCLNGTMSMDERKRTQELFAEKARILISTDAGGEGLNLQFCHVVINYDIPWNPMRLEQRIGRVDRIGQTHIVRALNFVLKDTVEHRVRQVLEQKLVIIYEEFGIDKTGDVLDSAQAGRMFDEVYLNAILDPKTIDTAVQNVADTLREQMSAALSAISVLGQSEALQPDEAQRLRAHPLPFWVERMTVNYIRANGGEADKRGHSWRLTWPDGETFGNVIFSNKEAQRNPTAQHINLEEPKVRDLFMQMPRYVPGQPIPVVAVTGIDKEVQGTWTLWRIAITAPEWSHYRIMPLFLANNGRVYNLTARHVWDRLLVEYPKVKSVSSSSSSQEAFENLRRVAEEQGRAIYQGLMQEHKNQVDREREKADYAYRARRRMIEHIGLPTVRNYRLNLLAREERLFYEQMELKKQAFPELTPLMVLRVEGTGSE
jgi:superfamily II DNA or RNA helicase